MATNRISARLGGTRAHGVDIAVDDGVRGTLPVRLGGQHVSLADFVARCAQSLRPGSEDDAEDFLRARDRFLDAGVAALAPTPDGSRWIQRDLAPADDPVARRELCRRLAARARGLLADERVGDFFFMHKPPGMRLRFRCTGDPADVAGAVDAELAACRADGLVEEVATRVYEPESALFGGPESMEYVHALFTVDSLVWLDHHACEVDPADAVPAWLVSLAMLRTFFAGLGVEGWEDLGVWDDVRVRGGRRLADDDITASPYAELADSIRDLWLRRDLIVQLLPAPVRAIVEEHDAALGAGAALWRAGYLDQDGAAIGPRAAAAVFVIFHWNRAGLAPVEQALVAESLARRAAS